MVEIPIKPIEISVLGVEALNNDILPEALLFPLGLEDAWLTEQCVDGRRMELAVTRRTEPKSSSSPGIFAQLAKRKAGCLNCHTDSASYAKTRRLSCRFLMSASEILESALSLSNMASTLPRICFSVGLD